MSSRLNTVSWTPMSEKKPSEYGWYLVAVQDQTDLGLSRWIETASWGNHWEYGDMWFGHESGSVTHWCELPSLPRDTDKPIQNIGTGRLMSPRDMEGDRND